MKQYYRNNIYLWIALPLLIAAVLLEFLSIRRLEPPCDTKKVYAIFEAKEKQIDKYISSVLTRISNTKSDENIWRLLNPADYQNGETYICVLDQDELIFWSSSLIAFPREMISQTDSMKLIHLPTGWFYVHSRTEGEITVKGFILIKREFPYKNKYIQSAFSADFDLPDGYAVRTEFQNGAINITRPDGKFLFSVEPIKVAGAEKNNVPLIALYFSFLFLLLAQINLRLRQSQKYQGIYRFLISFAVSVVNISCIRQVSNPLCLLQK